jgi:hypothetical protein
MLTISMLCKVGQLSACQCVGCTRCRAAEPGSLYTFEVWGKQLLDFIDEVIGEPTFLVSNSVGGAHSHAKPAQEAAYNAEVEYIHERFSVAKPRFS